MVLVGVAAATLAAVVAVPVSASAATVNSVQSWSAGTLNPGQSKSYVWNNANSDIYLVTAGGVSSYDPDRTCLIEVTNQQYRRDASGSRKFHLTVKNVYSTQCDVTVHLAILAADRSGSTGVLNPGQSKSWKWNNSNFESYVYVAGVNPFQPATGTCRLQTTWRYQVVPDGEAEYVWTVKNAGSVACGGTWRLGWLPVTERTWYPSDDPPAPPGHWDKLTTPVQDPFRVYVPGLVLAPTSAGTCKWATIWSRMWGDPAGSADARTVVRNQNVGSVACVVRGVMMAHIE